MFERPPFRTCGACGALEGVGLLSGGGRAYQLRCRFCRDTIVWPLPEVEKAVIYLDQFAFSELFKVEAGIRPEDAPNRGFWEALNSLVRRALLWQQAIFPSSDIHSSETIVARDAEALRAAYEMLGGDVQLLDTEQIESNQVWECFRAFREDRPPQFPVGPDEVLRTPSKRREWLPDMRIVTNPDYSMFATAIRGEVDRVAAEMSSLVEEWRRTKPTFEEALQIELTSYGKAKLTAFRQAAEWIERTMFDPDPLRMFDGALHPVMREFRELQRALEREGVEPGERGRTIIQLWQWPGNQQQPFVRISAYLFAALARKITAGQRKLPTRGFMNDVKAISAYAPHVDAMFLDRECAALLSEEPLRSELPLKARIFSLQSASAFLEYLEELAAHASSEIRESAKLLYNFE